MTEGAKTGDLIAELTGPVGIWLAKSNRPWRWETVADVREVVRRATAAAGLDRNEVLVTLSELLLYAAMASHLNRWRAASSLDVIALLASEGPVHELARQTAAELRCVRPVDSDGLQVSIGRPLALGDRGPQSTARWLRTCDDEPILSGPIAGGSPSAGEFEGLFLRASLVPATRELSVSGAKKYLVRAGVAEVLAFGEDP